MAVAWPVSHRRGSSKDSMQLSGQASWEGDVGLSTKPLADKVALVTGGSRSIGAAIAKRLAADGAAVAITYSASPDKAKGVVAAIEGAGGRALAIVADAGTPDAVRAAVAQTVETFGGIDILVNNAGIALGGPIEEI